MLIQALDLIANIGLVFLIIAVISWGIGYTKFRTSLKVFGFYLLINLCIQIAADLLWQQKINNLPLLHLQTLVEWLFFSLFFRWIYLDLPFFKRNINLILIFGALFIIGNSLFLEPLTGFNNNAKTAVQLAIVSYVFLYFFDAYGRVDYDLIENRTLLLICFAILLNYAGSLFIFMSSKLIPTDEAFQAFWLVNSCLSTIFQFIVMLAYFIFLRTQKASSPTK